MLKLSLEVKEIQIMMDLMMTRGDGSQEALVLCLKVCVEQ